MWITEAVTSILSQTYVDIELIVADDGSADDTVEIVGELARSDSRLRCVPSNGKGVIAARRTAYRYASGQLMANMDADDVALPDRIEVQVEAMSTGLDLCGTQHDFLFGDERRAPRVRLPLTQREAFVQLFESNPVSNPSVMFKRSTFGDDGLPYNPSFVPSSDYELWSRLLRDPSLRFANLPEVLMLYRAHQDQLTRPGSFANRVAAARVRYNLVRACGFDFSDSELRDLCVPGRQRKMSGSDDGERQRGRQNIDQQVQQYADRLFETKLPSAQ